MPSSVIRNESPAFAPRDAKVFRKISPSTSRLASLLSNDHYTSVRLQATAELATKRSRVAP